MASCDVTYFLLRVMKRRRRQPKPLSKARARNCLLRRNFFLFFCGGTGSRKKILCFGATGIFYTVKTVLCIVQKAQKSLSCAGKIDIVADGRMSCIYSWIKCVTYSMAWGYRGGGAVLCKIGPEGKKCKDKGTGKAGRERDHWRDLGVDGWIILGWICRRWDVGMWTGLGWPRTGTGGGRL